MQMDPIEFAREKLRRDVLHWANETLPMIFEEGGDLTKSDDEAARSLPDAMALALFPTDSYVEYRDLVMARIATITSERNGR